VTRFGTLTLLLAAIVLAGCIPYSTVSINGSGNVVTRKEAIAGFDQVDVSHAFQVDVIQGNTFRVVIRVDDNLVQHLNVVRQGNTLKIGLKPGRTYNIGRATMQAEVTMPQLTGLELSGASQGRVAGFESTKDVKLALSGASSLEGSINAGDAGFDVSGSSQVALRGSAQDVKIDASGASRVDLADFSVANADVDASGVSQVTVHVSGRLDANASGASSVHYLGNPTLGVTSTSGGATIERR